MSQHAHAVQSAVSTNAAAAPPSAGSNGAMKGALRGQSFEAQEAMLTPVQRKTPGAAPKEEKPKTTPMTAKMDGNPAADGAAKRPQVASVSKQSKLKLVQDLGKAKSIQHANALIGGFLSGLVTKVDTSVEADLKAEVEIEGIVIKLGYGVGLEHTDDGYEMKGDVMVGVGVGFDVSVVELAATLEGAVGFKSKGDTVGECFDLVMLAIDTWLRDRNLKFSATAPGIFVDAVKALGGGVWVADRVFGRAFAGEVIKKMDALKNADGTDNDGADSIEYTQNLALNVEASAGLAGVADLGAEVGGGYRTQSTLGKDAKTGKLKTEEDSGLTGKLAVSGSAFGIKGQTECEYFFGDELEASLSTSLTVPQKLAQVAAWGADAFSAYADALTAGALTKAGTIGAKIAALVKRATAAIRDSAIGALAVLGLGACELKFTLGLKLTNDALTGTFGIEIINKTGAGFEFGAGVVGAGVEGSIKTGTKILEKEFTLAEKKKVAGKMTGTPAKQPAGLKK